MAQSHPVRAYALSLLAPCPLRLTSALSPRRCDDQPVGLFDEPALVRVPRTAHVLPAAPLAYNPCPCPLRPLRGLVSPGSRTGPCTKPSSAPPLAGACWRSSSRVGRPLRRRGPTPLFPTPPPAATRPLLSVPGHPRLPAVRGRPCAATIAHTPSLGAFSLKRVPSTLPGRCRQHHFLRASPLRRVVTVRPCV